MNKVRLALIIVTTFLFSFQKKETVEIVLKNASHDDFKELKVNILGKEYSFSNLKKGDTTLPFSVDSSYRYSYALAITSKDTLVWQPQDFFGETMVKEGKILMLFEIIVGSGGRRLLTIK